MAITLTLTDGTQSISLANTARLCIESGSFMSVGSADEDVQETWALNWAKGITADQAASDMQDITQLLRNGERHYQEGLVDRATWLEFKPDDATNTQYAKVKGGLVGEISWRLIEGRDGFGVTITLTREGVWRSAAPDGTAGSSAVSGVTIYNKSDADGDNWVSIAATRANDEPGLLTITLDSGLVSDYLIAMKRGSTSFLNRFNPHFNPASQSSAHDKTADTLAPDDFRIDITADNTITWLIDGNDIAAYTGNYLVYVVNYQSSGAGSAQARFTTTYTTGEYKTVQSSVTDDLLFLGSFSLPGTEINPFITPAAGDDLTIGVQYDITSTATVGFFGLFLVPVDIPPMKLELNGTLTGTNEVVVNGVTQTAYTVNASGQSTYADTRVTMKGRYMTSIGNTVNRIYFYQWSDTNYGHNTSTVIDVTVVDRFAAVRGGA